MFDPAYPVAKLHPADYNPRSIGPEAIAALRASVDKMGIAKPIIAAPNGTIIAGHQRTNAIKALGLETAPVYIAQAVTLQDEIRFNQIHNGTDVDDEAGEVSVPAGTALGYSEVPATAVKGSMRAGGAVVRNEICRLIAKYGCWGAAVVNEAGEVLTGQQYALSCKILGRPCRIYRVANRLSGAVLEAFGRPYGEFHYEHLPKTTYAQTFAQMFRLRGGERENKSPTYENLVVPRLKKEERLLDFGCGQGDYVAALRRRGYRAMGVEFYRRKSGENTIDPAAVHRMCEELFSSLRRDGLFDVVVCDYVLNSTDSLKAEADVLTCVNAFCRMGGRIYLSGRRREAIEKNMKATMRGETAHRNIEFLDDAGYTALYNKGNWLYQKFHSKQQVHDLVAQYITPATFQMTRDTMVFQLEAVKTVEPPVEQVHEALAREFDLIWPGGHSVGRSAQAIAAWDAARARMVTSPEGSTGRLGA